MLNGLQHLNLLTFTHQNLSLEEIGQFHLEAETRQKRLKPLLSKLECSEVMFLSTCNRVALIWVAENSPTPAQILQTVYPDWDPASIMKATKSGTHLQGMEVARHLFRVSSSLESLVVGEREIITQVRQSYEQAQEMGFAGDVLRLLVQGAVKTAKKVFTETAIANRPVSVVNLACYRLWELKPNTESKIILIGAGQTIAAIARKLKKQGYHRFVIFNRTLSKAEELVEVVGGQAYPLSALSDYRKGFDVLISCTGSSEPIVTPEIFQKLLNGDTRRKVLVDLAIPNDIDEAVVSRFSAQSIQIEDLKEVAAQNLEARKEELSACNHIVETHLEEYEEAVRIRKIEVAMKQVPLKVKEIKQTALSEVFSQDIQQLDPQSRKTLEKVLSYMEKKYISVPMKMAREIMLDR
ncbi:MAG: glutamyl-tRNA reductase [Salibacteraceae bacterium]